MARGGRRPGAGRPREQTALPAEVVAKLAEGGELPLEYMLRIMRKPDADPRRRDEMAKAAAPFCHAKLGAQSQVTSEKMRRPAANVLSGFEHLDGGRA